MAQICSRAQEISKAEKSDRAGENLVSEVCKNEKEEQA